MRAACPKDMFKFKFFKPFICGKVILLPWFRAQYIFIINQVISYEHSTAENNVQTVYTVKMGEVWQQLQHKMIKFIYSAGTGTRKTGWFNGRTCGTCCITSTKCSQKGFLIPHSLSTYVAICIYELYRYVPLYWLTILFTMVDKRTWDCVKKPFQVIVT